MTEVRFLADSARQGRGFGSAGACASSFYIFRQFRNAGLRTSFQSFEAAGEAGHNVIGVTPGWFRSYIVVGAYFDGVGSFDGVSYPGADANASGVAALLCMARSLPQFCRGDVGLIFVAFDGHGAGLSGSREFLARYSIEYPIGMMVNIDQIGSSLSPLGSGREDFIIMLGGHTLPDYYMDWFSLCNRLYGANLEISDSYYGSETFTRLFYRLSDQRPFVDNGIPSVLFTSGITMNNNKTYDIPESLNYPVMRRRIILIYHWLDKML